MKVPRSTRPNQKRRYFIRMLLAALLTTIIIATGGFGAFSDNPLTAVFQDVIGINFPPELLNPFNAYMLNLSAPQIPPEADSVSDEASPPDPVGMILSFFGTEPTSNSDREPPFDPVGMILSFFGTVPTSNSDGEPPFDPVGIILSFFGIESISNADGESSPDPVGMILSFFDTESISTANEPSFINATITALVQTQTQVVIIQSRTATITPVQTQTAIPSVTFTLPPTATQSPIPTWTFLPIYFPPTATKKIEPYPTFTSTNIPINTSTNTSTNTPTNTPTPIPNRLVLYLGGISEGNIGPRNIGDAFCAANHPAGFSNYRVFIGYSAADSIANMASNYGMPTNLPIQSTTNVVIGNDWSDLVDGNIDVALSAAGVLSPGDWWWSGSEDGFGNHINGTTASCMGWTSNSGSDPGIAGYHGDPNSPWLRDTIAGCGDPLPVLCIAY